MDYPPCEPVRVVEQTYCNRGVKTLASQALNINQQDISLMGHANKIKTNRAISIDKSKQSLHLIPLIPKSEKRKIKYV